MHLQLQHINKKFGHESVIHDLSLQLKSEKTLSILGASGSGKTTLLKIIAGLLEADSGAIYLDEKNVTDVPPNKRNIVYIYQEPLLFPHLDVYENIAFGLRIRNVATETIQLQVKKMMDRLELTEQAQKFPEQLSGGQRQRVAFGRAIIINPPVLLLDEPFASLDFETRGSMQKLFKEVSHEFRITSIFVTHDLKEAMLMADEIAWMREGTLQHYESLQDFKNDPRSGVQKELDFWKSI
ncbi:MAG TPA: ABC transporter ATP-binding protein [Chitinophagales bacterium]|nr:ABC transporter ATP-binding protein [Chitinophagales bacterium]